MIIYYIEDRGATFFGHFILYMMAGLYNIENNYYIRNNDSKLLNDSRIIYNTNEKSTYPIFLYIKNITLWQRDIVNTLDSNKFILLETIPENTSTIISVYGAPCAKNPCCDEPNKYFFYTRNLFLRDIYYFEKNKNVFITRIGSEKYHNNIKKRHILNENDLVKCLNKYNFIYINLEELTMKEKVLLFNTSNIIISTHGASLTCSLFANKNTKIIEIVNKGESNGFHINHYKFICETMEISYYRYSDILEDTNGNMNINIDKFEKYLLTLL